MKIATACSILSIAIMGVASGVNAQFKKNDVLSSFRLNISTEQVFKDHDSRFQATIGSRTGIFLFNNSWNTGINWSVTYKTTKINRISSIQTGGLWYEKGGGHGWIGSAGIFADKYYHLNGNLYFSLNNDLSYYFGVIMQETNVVDQNGNDIGIGVYYYDYNPTTLQYNCWPQLLYFFTKTHAINCSIGTLRIYYNHTFPSTTDDAFKTRTWGLALDFPAVGFGYTIRF